MSIYELIDYDALLDRIGIQHDQEWFCGSNQPENYSYDDVGLTYDDVINYNGRTMHKPGGLCLSADVNVNGLVLNTRDTDGTLWLCTGIDGWWTLPPAEILDVPKPYWDGSMLTTGRYLTRTVTISGCFIPPDASWVWYNRDKILRSCGIVRGVGLLATCGNESESNPELLTRVVPDPTEADPDRTKIEQYPNTFYDPAKMALIQTADSPLVDTIRPNGFTQFSLSFRCSYPTKTSVKERIKIIPVQPVGSGQGRVYESFSTTVSEGVPEDDPLNKDTTYTELMETPLENYGRPYHDVKFFNPDNPIEDEDDPPLLTGGGTGTRTYRNQGNYFAFPVIVIGESTGVTVEKPLSFNNLTTKETMYLVKDVPKLTVLVVDSLARRVALVKRSDLDRPDSWIWNARDYLALESEWISLAPGDNIVYIQKDETTGFKLQDYQPVMYWRDTWIG
jgi:hypothetical protein